MAEYSFTFNGNQTIEINGSNTKNHFIQLYSADTTGLMPSERVFWGDINDTDTILDGYIGILINGTKRYIPVYVGSATTGCCSNLQGEYINDYSSSSFYGWALLSVNGTNKLFVPVYNITP